MNVIIQTLGCRLNQIESESIAKFFADVNFSVNMDAISASSAVNEEVAVCVVNSCAVTQKSEQKARRMIRLLLEKFPNACVIVTGCYAELSKDALLQMDERIAVLPGQRKSRIESVARALAKTLANGEASDSADASAGSEAFASAEAAASGDVSASAGFNAARFAKKIQREIFDAPQETPRLAEQTFKLATETFAAHSRASLKIQDGCNGACSYCTIKNARGKSVSLDAASVIERAVALEKSGHNEIVLTGVNVAQYKSEYNGNQIDFVSLLELLLKNTNSVAFRLSSVWPTVVSDRFCSVISDARVRPHFHLSVQSGSDKILSAMRRSYTSRDVANAVAKIRAVKGEPFFACDIIAGFPGENEDDFSDTMQLMKECNFAWIHAFPFSARPGTEAFDMKPKIAERVAGERVAALFELAKKNKTAYINSFSGKIVDAIAESARHGNLVLQKKSPLAETALAEASRAVTENFLHCEFVCDTNAPKSGEKIRLQIMAADDERVAKGAEYDVKAKLICS